MKRVKEVSLLTGVTRRTLQYYDDQGLVSVQRSKENYRMYDDEAIEKLWQVLFYREIGFSLEEIKTIMALSEEEWLQQMEQRIEDLTEEQHELERQICFVKAVKRYGIPPVCCRGDGKHMTYAARIRVLKEALIGVMGGKSKYMSDEADDSLPDKLARWMDERCGK